MSDEAHGPAEELIIANGVDGATGRYLLPPLTPQQVAALARGEAIETLDLQELILVKEQREQGTYGPRAGIDPKNLAETGWAVLFAHDADPAIREALGPLLELRRSQAGQRKEQYYREFGGPDGYRPGENHRQFLARHGTSPGMPADPNCVPYYVLIVGDPESIPYPFQYQLDVMYATGRIHFDTLEEYERYARSVVEAESGRLALPRRAAFFGVQNPDDPATQLSARFLVKPLAEKLAERPEWVVQTVLGQEATKARLARLLGGPETPAVLFTASHGMGFPSGDPRQLPHQGALLCQDWPGPLARQPIPPEQYFAADDVADEARLLGLIAVHFACYGAGTPREDEFAHRLGRERATVAERAFLARLPQRLLGHPKGGALAAVGHVERAWGYSFHWPRVGQQTQVFEDFFRQLLDGHPIGSALECFNLRYASLAAELSEVLEDIRFGKRVEDLPVANMWTANNDAKNYVILGDPAVRLPVGEAADGRAERPMIAAVVRPPSRPADRVPTPAAPPAGHADSFSAPDNRTPARREAAMNERFGIVGNARDAWPSGDELRALGVAWVRTIVYSFDELDAALANHPRDVKVIALLNSENDAVRFDLSGWDSAIEQFARRFAGRVHSVECLNEWDLLGIPVETAANCARTAAPVLAQAGIRCLLGSVAGPNWQEALTQIVALLSPEEKAAMAGACFHPYGKSVNGFPPGFVFGEIADGVRRANELTGLPIYLTEFGIKLSDAGGEAGQATYFRQTYEVLRQLPPDVLAAACYFCWSDRTGAPEEQGDHAFGLLRRDDTPRPAHEICCALAESAALPFAEAAPGAHRRTPGRGTLAESARLRVFGHAGPYRLEELQVAAYRVAEWAPARPIGVIPTTAIFRYWQAHKEVGPAATSELPVADADGGGTAVITTTGRVLRSTGRDRVEVV